MEKDKKLFLGIIFVLIAFVIFVSVLAFQEKKEKMGNVSTDAFTFKKEYESLNNMVHENNGKTMKELTIASDNPVTIVGEEKAVALLENGTGILYMGFSDCPWCRTMVPVLLQSLAALHIDQLYYLNIQEIRDVLVLNDKNKVETIKEGTESYYKMLEIMDSVLEPYYLETENGKKIDTKEKRIYAPAVIGFKDGEIVGAHLGTVESYTDPYQDLTKEQQIELTDSYKELIRRVYDIECDDAC